MVLTQQAPANPRYLLYQAEREGKTGVTARPQLPPKAEPFPAASITGVGSYRVTDISPKDDRVVYQEAELGWLLWEELLGDLDQGAWRGMEGGDAYPSSTPCKGGRINK